MPGYKVHSRDSIVLACVVTPAVALTVGPLQGLAAGAGCVIGIAVTPDWDLLETQTPDWQEWLSFIVWLMSLGVAVVLLLRS